MTIPKRTGDDGSSRVAHGGELPEDDGSLDDVVVEPVGEESSGEEGLNRKVRLVPTQASYLSTDICVAFIIQDVGADRLEHPSNRIAEVHIQSRYEFKVPKYDPATGEIIPLDPKKYKKGDKEGYSFEAKLEDGLGYVPYDNKKSKDRDMCYGKMRFLRDLSEMNECPVSYSTLITCAAQLVWQNGLLRAQNKGLADYNEELAKLLDIN